MHVCVIFFPIVLDNVMIKQKLWMSWDLQGGRFLMSGMGKQYLSWAFCAKRLAKEDASTKAMGMKWQFFYFHYVIIH